jgi:hypothetical protein
VCEDLVEAHVENASGQGLFWSNSFQERAFSPSEAFPRWGKASDAPKANLSKHSKAKSKPKSVAA